ncbi:MAG: 4-(cytidine 5'-diphospho)-2-C-methyl-D-erythritol kinase [bacterium]
MSDQIITIDAPAKINLGLHLDPDGPKGYHAIQTIFQEVKFSDQLTVRVLDNAEDDELYIDGPVQLDVTPDNLVFQTLDFLRERGISIPPVRVELEKNIPTGSGLGGGSSDAAALIKAAEQLFNIETSTITDNELAFELGADVPFFRVGGTCIGEGIGEQLTQLPHQKAHVLLAYPPHSVSTEEAYDSVKNFTLRTDYKPNIVHLTERLEEPAKLWKKIELENDFEPVLLDRFKIHNTLKHDIMTQTQWVGTSGSGSTLYGLFDCEEDVSRGKQKLESKWEGVEFIVTRTS